MPVVEAEQAKGAPTSAAHHPPSPAVAIFGADIAAGACISISCDQRQRQQDQVHQPRQQAPLPDLVSATAQHSAIEQVATAISSTDQAQDAAADQQTAGAAPREAAPTQRLAAEQITAQRPRTELPGVQSAAAEMSTAEHAATEAGTAAPASAEEPAAPTADVEPSTAHNAAAAQSTAQHAATERSMAQHAAPEQSTAQHAAPEPNTAQHAATEQSTAHNAAAEQSTAQHTAPEQSTPQHAAPEQSMAQHAATEQTAGPLLGNKASAAAEQIPAEDTPKTTDQAATSALAGLVAQDVIDRQVNARALTQSDVVDSAAVLPGLLVEPSVIQAAAESITGMPLHHHASARGLQPPLGLPFSACWHGSKNTASKHTAISGCLFATHCYYHPVVWSCFVPCQGLDQSRNHASKIRERQWARLFVATCEEW